MKILHLISGKIGGTRIQRYIDNNYKNGFNPIILAPVNSGVITNDPRTKIWSKCRTFNYNFSGSFRNMFPFSRINLKSVFEKEECDLVHAHSIETAIYSKKLGLPTVYDDCEFNLKYSELMRIQSFNYANLLKKALVNRLFIKRINAIKELLKTIPIIVTNDEVKNYYKSMGARKIWTVPNVPVQREIDYALKCDFNKKARVVTTFYIGDMTVDNNRFLRCTQGVRELWYKERLGKLFVFEGLNMVPHLDIMGIIRRFHFNLLFWRPLNAHKYYLQNKAFLASAMGIPTIISSSLTSTIKLLRDHALIVNSLEEIPDAIKGFEYGKVLAHYDDHHFEFYEDRIVSAYEESKC